MKLSGNRMSYLTMDNGGHPFRVVIESDNKVVVWAYNHERKRPYLSFVASQILIGDDSEIAEHGNSVIVQKQSDAGRNEYYFIGDTIFKFRTMAPLVHLASPMGNSSVPYPWALDTLGNIYLMIEKVVLKTNLNPNVSLKEKRAADPYSLYYGHAKFKSPADFTAEHPATKKIYKLKWSPNPDKNWSYALQQPADYPFLELGKDAYLATILAYGNAAGLYKLDFIEEVMHRTI